MYMNLKTTVACLKMAKMAKMAKKMAQLQRVTLASESSELTLIVPKLRLRKVQNPACRFVTAQFLASFTALLRIKPTKIVRTGSPKLCTLSELLIFIIAIAATNGFCQEQPATSASTDLYQLKEVVVQGKSTTELPLSAPLPEVSGAQINSGKKTTVADLEALPPITSNNYRQAFSQLPGLLTSEVGNESFSSFSYRGLGIRMRRTI